MDDYVLRLSHITKRFPGIKALDDVHFELKRGEIHALMGENGAGKSTFIKVITGVHVPEEGEIFVGGKKVVFKSPKDAQNHSIAAIYQHGTAYAHLSVTENIFMGHEILTRFGTLDHRRMHEAAREHLLKLQSDIDPRAEMGTLTVAEQQVVEIAKAISQNAKIIIMDEPTAALSDRESERLYEITEALRDDGCSVIFISHRFEDMYRLADRVTVFRDSKYIGTYGVDEISNEELIKKMVGREVAQIYPKTAAARGKEILRVENLCAPGHYKDVSFSVHRGEIFAITGLVGAGRTEVCLALFGIKPAKSGKIFFDGKKISVKSPSDAMAEGIGLLPEDRRRQGLVLDWSIADNITLSTLKKYVRGTVLNRRAMIERAKELSARTGTKAQSVFDKADTLSGGNQQKVIVSKLLDEDAKLLILDEPTKGVDVGAKAQIYEIMSHLAGAGYGILMVSSELPEVLGMADTVMVMAEGQVTGIFENKNLTQEQLLKAAMRS